MINRLSFNFYNSLNFGRDELSDMFEYMEATLAAARENGDKVTSFSICELHLDSLRYDLTD